MTDPISAQLVMSAVTEAGRAAAGEVGRQAWTTFTGLVRRMFGHDSETATAAELVATDPGDIARTGMLAGVIAERARTDPAFAAELRLWLDAVAALGAPRTGSGDVTNVIGPGATVTGIVVQAREIHGMNTYGHGPA